MSVGTPAIDRELPLAELLDIEGFREVCRSFSELYAIGIKVFDSEGNKLVDVRASNSAHCGYLYTVTPTQKLCTELVNHIRNVELKPVRDIATVNCFSGLRYKIVPLVYDGNLHGRFIFGPYAPEDLVGPPPALKKHEARGLSLKILDDHLQKIPRASEDTVAKVLDHIDKVLAVLIHTSFRQQITTKLHVESMGGAFEDLERTNREMKKAMEKLRDLDRLKSNFIATVSHELRTPLTSVIGYSEMLLEGLAGDLSGEQREYIKTILEKGESLLNLITQVLDLSRIESGNVLMSWEEVDIRAVINLAVSDVLPQAHKKGLTLAVDTAVEVDPIVADRDKVRRILGNLLSNSVKFTRAPGSIVVKTDVHQLPPQDPAYDIFEPERNRYLRVQVSDTGIGIPRDKLDDIFNAFYQVDNSSTREYGGTGLGLTIARNFAHAHRGRIEVTSSEGTGSTFVVLLPYRADRMLDSVAMEILAASRPGPG